MAVKAVAVLALVCALGGCDQTGSNREPTAAAPTVFKPIRRSDIEQRDTSAVDECVFGDLIDFLESVDDKDAAAQLQKLPESLQTYYAVEIVEDEVNDGGFNQYFFNTAPAYVAASIPAFQRIGLRQFADLMTRAIGVARTSKESAIRKHAQQAGSVKAFSDTYKETSLGQFDHEWAKLPSPMENGVAYLRAHLDEFTSADGRRCPASD